MSLSDVAIKRPVFTTMLALGLIVLGGTFRKGDPLNAPSSRFRAPV